MYAALAEAAPGASAAGWEIAAQGIVGQHIAPQEDKTQQADPGDGEGGDQANQQREQDRADATTTALCGRRRWICWWRAWATAITG